MLKDRTFVQIPITIKEAALLKVLRENPYGTFTVTTHENEPIRVVIASSKMLTEQDGLLFATKDATRVYTLPIETENK